MIKFPNIDVKITDNNGNAFFIIGAVIKAMKRGGCTKEQVDTYKKAAQSGNYDNLLRVTMDTINVL